MPRSNDERQDAQRQNNLKWLKALRTGLELLGGTPRPLGEQTVAAWSNDEVLAEIHSTKVELAQAKLATRNGQVPTPKAAPAIDTTITCPSCMQAHERCSCTTPAQLPTAPAQPLDERQRVFLETGVDAVGDTANPQGVRLCPLRASRPARSSSTTH